MIKRWAKEGKEANRERNKYLYLNLCGNINPFFKKKSRKKFHKYFKQFWSVKSHYGGCTVEAQHRENPPTKVNKNDADVRDSMSDGFLNV